MNVNVLSSKDGQVKESLALDDGVFAAAYKEPLVHQMLVSYQANGRQATVGHKNRSAVSGGGKKPWAQKGGGRARAGTSRSPLWRGGGKTFLAPGRTYDQKLNKKMYRSAMRGLLSELIRQERLFIVDELNPESHKTKDFAATLKVLDLKSVLILVESIEGNLDLATRNLPFVGLNTARSLNPVDLLAKDRVLVTQSAIKQIERQLQ